MAVHKRWSYPRNVRFNGEWSDLFSLWNRTGGEKQKELTPHGDDLFN